MNKPKQIDFYSPERILCLLFDVCSVFFFFVDWIDDVKYKLYRSKNVEYITEAS